MRFDLGAHSIIFDGPSTKPCLFMNEFIVKPAFGQNRKSTQHDFFGQQPQEFFIAPSKKNNEKTYDLGKIEKLLKELCQSALLNQKIALPTDHGIDFIQVKSIIRCEGSKKYTRIYTTDAEPILSSYNIGKFKKLFEDITVFFLSHKSHLVNISYIKNYQRSGLIQMIDDTIVPVSVRRRNSFLDLIMN